MFAWFAANLINIALTLAVGLVVALLIRGLIRDKKAGRPACGGSCAGCGACGGCRTCHGGQNPPPVKNGGAT